MCVCWTVTNIAGPTKIIVCKLLCSVHNMHTKSRREPFLWNQIWDLGWFLTGWQYWKVPNLSYYWQFLYVCMGKKQLWLRYLTARLIYNDFEWSSVSYQKSEIINELIKYFWFFPGYVPHARKKKDWEYGQLLLQYFSTQLNKLAGVLWCAW